MVPGLRRGLSPFGSSGPIAPLAPPSPIEGLRVRSGSHARFPGATCVWALARPGIPGLFPEFCAVPCPSPADRDPWISGAGGKEPMEKHMAQPQAKPGEPESSERSMCVFPLSMSMAMAMRTITAMKTGMSMAMAMRTITAMTTGMSMAIARATATAGNRDVESFHFNAAAHGGKLILRSQANPSEH